MANEAKRTPQEHECSANSSALVVMRTNLAVKDSFGIGLVQKGIIQPRIVSFFVLKFSRGGVFLMLMQLKVNTIKDRRTAAVQKGME
ncbi:hypothetical protein MHH52_25835 [Paenibacillus sp. FSL K6-0276]|uniref:hypothetical protein n=1 Tax=Paenibacillus sp. FSL K6-0276 TaxID=2921450 RepID=UPI0030EF3763